MSDQAQTESDVMTLARSVDLYVDIARGDWGDAAETSARVQKCTAVVLKSLTDSGVPLELSVRLTDDDELQQLNSEYRSQDKPTNVLSFPGYQADELEEAFKLAGAGGPPVMLGDVAIARGVTAREANDQGKSVEDHLMHLVVHGILHLLGFDHIEKEDAEEMEILERKILSTLGIDDPYSVES